MPQTNRAFALLTLGQWCRNHGIHEIRDALHCASALAEGAESSELLAAALEEAAIAADVVVCPAPEVPVQQFTDEQEIQSSRKGKRTGPVSIDVAMTN